VQEPEGSSLVDGASSTCLVLKRSLVTRLESQWHSCRSGPPSEERLRVPFSFHFCHFFFFAVWFCLAPRLRSCFHDRLDVHRSPHPVSLSRRTHRCRSLRLIIDTCCPIQPTPVHIYDAMSSSAPHADQPLDLSRLEWFQYAQTSTFQSFLSNNSAVPDPERTRIQTFIDQAEDYLFKLPPPPDAALIAATLHNFQLVSSPARKLPDDILTAVFLIANTSSPIRLSSRSGGWTLVGMPWTLSHVCENWRRACIGYAVLWADFSVEVEWRFRHASPPPSLSSNLKQLIQLGLSRTKKAPLTLRLEISNERILDLLQIFADSGAYDRIGKLSLRMEFDDLSDAIQTMSGRMNSLESLSLRAFRTDLQVDRDIEMHAFPSLTTIKLAVIDMPHRLKLPWSQLHELDFRAVYIDPFEGPGGFPAFGRTLRQCTRLRRIVFDDVHLDDHSEDQTPATGDGLFESPSVKECVVRLNGMLNRLTFPQLERLEMAPFDYLAFTAFLHRSQSILQSLHIQVPEDMEQTEWENSIRLLDSLVDLTVDATRVAQSCTYISSLLTSFLPPCSSDSADTVSCSYSPSSPSSSSFHSDCEDWTPLPVLAHLTIRTTLDDPCFHSDGSTPACEELLGDVILPFLRARFGVPHDLRATASASQCKKLQSFAIIEYSKNYTLAKSVACNTYGSRLASILRMAEQCQHALEEIEAMKDHGADIHLFHRKWTVVCCVTVTRNVPLAYGVLTCCFSQSRCSIERVSPPCGDVQET
jgi:hypothetical protein